MQVYDIGSRFMIDSKAVVPVQKWVDAEKIDLKVYEPNLLAYLYGRQQTVFDAVQHVHADPVLQQEHVQGSGTGSGKTAQNI
jgi:hypothetical protein